LPPLRFALDEIVYVVEGRGFTTVWAEGRPKKVFEWQKHSMFLLPRNYYHQLTNTRGDRPTRLLNYNYLPIAMSIVPDARFFFGNSYADPDMVYAREGEFYSEAKIIRSPRKGKPSDGQDSPSDRAFWLGNFFPDMKAWDKLIPYKGRGAGGHAVWIRFSDSPLYSHMSVFPSRTYKKAHRHGPGVVIVIPDGEGYSIMWEEGREKVIIPWHEASVFVPPNRWYHQHFNVGAAPARYLAFHAPRSVSGYTERAERRARDQIEYPNEEIWIRKKFEEELGKKGLTSLMPDAAYKNKDFEWTYADDED
jgi:oxalate decarboxylase/phosphoglucose isomerase-like protein (cupin superfamily)